MPMALELHRNPEVADTVHQPHPWSEGPMLHEIPRYRFQDQVSSRLSLIREFLRANLHPGLIDLRVWVLVAMIAVLTYGVILRGSRRYVATHAQLTEFQA